MRTLARPLVLASTIPLLMPSGAAAERTLAAGGNHVLVLTGDGNVWGWGSNGVTMQKIPTLVPLTGVVSVAAGQDASYALQADGTLWAWGYNGFGQLGTGNAVSSGTPVFVTDGVVAVAAGQRHALILKSDGTVWGWGANSSGQIGDGSYTTRLSPVRVTSLEQTVVAIAASNGQSFALMDDGTVRAWGANNYGQLGDGTQAIRPAPVLVLDLAPVTSVRAAMFQTYAWAEGTPLFAWGYNSNGQLVDGTFDRRTLPIQSAFGPVADIRGGSHVVAVMPEGGVWTWGSNGAGQLGDGTTTTRTAPAQLSGLVASAVDAGSSSSVAVSSDGRVWTWGSNVQGQIGDGTTTSRLTPVQISEEGFNWRVATPNFSYPSGTYNSTLSVAVTCLTPGATIHYTTDGTEPTESDPSIVSGGTVGVVQNITLKARAWLAGTPTSNVGEAHYTLAPYAPSFSPGSGTYTSARTVTMSTSTSAAEIRYTTDGSTPTSSSTLYTSAITISSNTTLKAIALRYGWASSSVNTATYAFNYGTLAAPTASPATGTFEGDVSVTLSAASGTTIRYTTNGYEPTSNSTAYTGPLTFSTTTTLKAKAYHPDYTASPTTTQTYTIATTRPVLSVPSGTYAPGQLVTIAEADASATIRITLTGIDPTTSDPTVASGTSLLVGAFTLKVRASKTGCLESAVVSATYALTEPMGGGALAAGGSHAVIATPDGLVYGWGLNSSGQVGDGTNTNRTTPKLLQTLTGVTALSAGSAHTLAATLDGRAFAWGSNGSGRLGDGTLTNHWTPVQVPGLDDVVSVAAGGSHSLALTAGGLVYAWGYGASGQLGLGSTASISSPALIPTLSDVVAIGAGASHSLALTSSGQLYAWGLNTSGQVGDGTNTMRTSPTPVGTISDVAAIAAGSAHSAARVQSGAIYVWGAGNSGQLGLGTTSSRNVPTAVPDLIAADIVAGASHTAAVRSDGALVAWGANSFGQLGDTTTTMRLDPVLVVGPLAVAYISAGDSHTVAIAPGGDLWTWGQGSAGQLGDSSTITRPTPQVVATFPGTWGGTGTPELTPPGGTYDSPQTVSVSVVTAGAIAHYTTTGAVPTELDPVVPPDGIAVSGTVTIRVRAWAADRAPSAIATATYTLQPSTPAIAPGTGTYTAARTVTIGTTTNDTTLRYTIDGSDPTEASPLYSGAFSVATLTTVKARAFRDGWTPSPIASTTFFFEYGTLQPPVATPGSGTYPPDQLVSLSAEPDTTIRYTLDGSDPNADSTAYTAPLTLPTGLVTLKARAFRTDWTPSAVGTWTYQITTDFTPPTITADVSPAPNAAGWYETDVTVSFTCSDAESGIATCSPPASVTTDGAAIEITGEAVDAAGNRATITVVLNVDRQAPRVRFFTPLDGDLFPASQTSVAVRGGVTDFASGVASVTCNGDLATISDQAFTCSVAVTPGQNTIQVEARDVAGHVASAQVTITVADVAPTSIELTPSQMTMLANERRQLSVKDNLGRPLPDATWTVANPLVAEIQVVDGETYLHALSAGETTLTLAYQALSAQATLTVLAAGTALDPGTILWSLEGTPPADGDVLRAVPAPRGPEDPEGAELFFIERGTPTRIRATTMDGRQLWTTEINRPVKHIAADNAGGLVIVLPLLDYDGNFASIQRLDAATGRLSWEYVPLEEYSSPDDTRNHTEVAIRSDNTIFVTEPHETYTELVALDGTTGAVRGRTNLGYSQVHRWMDGVNDVNARWWMDATAPLVQPDGSVAVLAHRFEYFSYWEHRYLPGCGECEAPTTGPLDDQDNEHVVLYEVPEGAFTPSERELSLENFEAMEFDRLAGFQLDRLVPDGLGGLLAGASEAGRIFRIAAGSVSRPLELYTAGERISGPSEYVVGDAAYVLVRKPEPDNWSWVASLVSFDPATLTVLSETPIPSFGTPRLAFALASGGVRVTDALQRQVRAVAAAGWIANGLGMELRDLGVSIDAAWQQPRGNNNDQNNLKKPKIAAFLGVDPLTVNPPHRTAEAFMNELLPLGAEGEIEVYRNERAHMNEFAGALVPSSLEMLAFIGHGGYGDPGTGYEDQSISLRFDTTGTSLMAPTIPQLVPFPEAIYGVHYMVLPPHVDTPAKIVFLAQCWIRGAMKAVFAPSDSRALVITKATVNVSPPVTDVLLNRAAEALKLLVKYLMHDHMTVRQAVDAVNRNDVITKIGEGEIPFILDVVDNLGEHLQLSPR